MYYNGCAYTHRHFDSLTTASLGATRRTRYYAVRAHRLLQEHQAEKIVLTYCPTKLMVADSLTKLATGEVIGVLLAAMDSQLPALTAARRTSATPGPANRGPGGTARGSADSTGARPAGPG